MGHYNDGVEIDNNTAERALHPIVLGSENERTGRSHRHPLSSINCCLGTWPSHTLHPEREAVVNSVAVAEKETASPNSNRNCVDVQFTAHHQFLFLELTINESRAVCHCHHPERK
jgi:hypothetical protein